MVVREQLTLAAILRRAVMLGPVATAACGANDLILPSDARPATLSIVSGDGQVGPTGNWVGQPLVVRVQDATERPVRGVLVTFTFVGAAPGASLDPTSGTTDDAGERLVSRVVATEITMEMVVTGTAMGHRAMTTTRAQLSRP